MAQTVDPTAAQDPAYLAFMRGAGYDESEILANLARRQSQLNAQYTRAQPGYQDQMRQAVAGVQDDFTGRGLGRSGASAVHTIDAANVVRRQQADFNAGIADQRSDLQADSMTQIASLRRQAQEQAITARQGLATGNAQYGAS